MIIETNMKTILDSPNSNELFEVYFSEGSRGLLPKHNVNKEIFYKMEQAGLTDCFGVFDKKKLVGFVISSTRSEEHTSELQSDVCSSDLLRNQTRG